MASIAICGRRNPVDSSKKPFAPRVGFAYRLTDKTVVRGGYGIFFDASETREIDDSGDVYPFVVRQNYTPTGDPTTPKLTDNMQPPIIPHTVSAATDGSQFFAVQISDSSAQSVCPAVVAVSPAPTGGKHNAGGELRWKPWLAPAEPHQYQPAFSNPQPRSLRCHRGGQSEQS